MWVIILLLIVAIVILLVKLKYQKHVIDDLKISKKNLKKKYIAATIDVLLEIKNVLDNYSEPATRDTLLRNFLNETIQELSDEYKKHELVQDSQTEN